MSRERTDHYTTCRTPALTHPAVAGEEPPLFAPHPGTSGAVMPVGRVYTVPELTIILNGMRRALRWLWRQFCAVALMGLVLLGGIVCAAPATPAFAEESRAMLRQTTSAQAPTPQERERARERAHRGRLLFLGSLLYQGAVLGAFLLRGGTRWLARITTPFGGRWALAVAVVFGIITLATAVLTFPLDYYAGFVFQHQYGLSNQTFPQWLRDYAVAGGVNLLLGFPLVLLLYLVLRRSPCTWWLWMTAASAPLTLFLVLIQPVFIAPLFNKFTPLQDQQLKQDILALAHRQGIAADDVFQVDASRQSNAANAYVNGVGPTQRIVLYDTLLEHFSHDEIIFVMAHEMGHYVLGHIRQGIVLSILGTLASSFLLYRLSGLLLRRYGGFLGFTTLGNPAGYPLLMALGMAVSLVALPLGNAYSRHLERQADRYALKVYPHPEAGIGAFHQLARLNVAEDNPPRWAEILLSSHPSLSQRIAALEEAKRASEAPGQ